MPNGDYFDDDEWRKYVSQLEPMRQEIKSFAAQEGIEVSFYYHGWPHFTFQWENAHHITCQIGFGLDTDDRATYNLTVGCWKDVDQQRYSVRKRLEQGLTPPFVTEIILEKIKKAIALCNSYRLEDLSLSKPDQ